MTSNIPVKETIEDKNSWFNIKRFSISGIVFEKPIKTLDTKVITQDTYNKFVKKSDIEVTEVSKTVKGFNSIKSLYEESNDTAINSFFSKKTWLDSQPNVINFTFNFNPFDYITDIDDMSGFFDLYYEYSRLFLTIPNLKLEKYNQEGKKESLISIEKYLDFVDSTFDVLNTKNHKPVFVPISLRTSLKDLENISNHYLKQDYLNFWIDFEGKAINEQTLGRLRHLYRILKEKEQFKNVVCYCTNIKREIISNSKLDKSPASDVLASISGANIIGVDREPPRPFFGKITDSVVAHKTRVLDRKTYYYVKTDNENLTKKDANITYNAVKLNEEFNSQSKHFLKDLTIVDAIKQKSMLKTHEKILKALTTKPPASKKLTNWF